MSFVGSQNASACVKSILGSSIALRQLKLMKELVTFFLHVVAVSLSLTGDTFTNQVASW